jgi:hypothetical protein
VTEHEVSFTVDPGDPSDDEVLSGGGLPRWIGWLAALSVFAVALSVTIANGGDKPTTPQAGQTPTPALPSPTATPVFGAGEALDVTTGPTGTWVLEGAALATVGGRRVARSISLDGLKLTADSSPRLAVDVPAHRIWIVVANATPTRMVEFDQTTLQRIRQVTWRQLVYGAVAYRGHLYLSTGRGVADLAPDASVPRYVGGLGGAVGPIAVDLTRGRLIVMDLGYPTDIWAYRPGSRPFEVAVPLRFGKGSLAIVNGAIWVGGFGDHGAVLDRLDPATLQPIVRTRPAEFGPGAVVTGAGARVLWVLAGGGSGALACVSATTGRVEQRWRLASINAVASDAMGGLVATSNGLLGLILSGCQG